MLIKPSNLYQSNEFQDAISKKNRIKRTFPIVIFAVHLVAAIIVPTLVMYYSATPKLFYAESIFILVILSQIAVVPFLTVDTYSMKDIIKTEMCFSIFALIGGSIAIIVALNKLALKATIAIIQLIPKIITIVVVIFIVTLIIKGIMSLIKWIAWNGYSNTFIAISLKGNIKRFNSITEIQEKLPQNATLEEVVSKLEQYATIIKTERGNHFFW